MFSGAALSPRPVEPQGLRKQRETWAFLEIFRLIECNRGSLLVSVSQNLQVDQRSLRVSKPSAADEEKIQPTSSTLLLSSSTPAMNDTTSVLSWPLLMPYKR